MPNQVPKEVVQERYERLAALQERISWEENQAQIGRTVDVLVAAGEGRKDEATHRLSGRAEDNRLVHFALPAGVSAAEMPRPGDVVTVSVTSAAPHFVIADSAVDAVEPIYALRRTRAGDAWDRRQAESCGAPVPAALGEAPRAVGLGMPVLRIGG